MEKTFSGRLGDILDSNFFTVPTALFATAAARGAAAAFVLIGAAAGKVAWDFFCEMRNEKYPIWKEDPMAGLFENSRRKGIIAAFAGATISLLPITAISGLQNFLDSDTAHWELLTQSANLAERHIAGMNQQYAGSAALQSKGFDVKASAQYDRVPYFWNSQFYALHSVETNIEACMAVQPPAANGEPYHISTVVDGQPTGWLPKTKLDLDHPSRRPDAEVIKDLKIELAKNCP